MAVAAASADLTVQLPGETAVSHHRVHYRCDAGGSKLGLPSGAFAVDYINGGGNSLAVVPISGKPLIFVTVLSGSGARYAAQQFIWWEAHNAVTVSSPIGQAQAVCKPVQ